MNNYNDSYKNYENYAYGKEWDGQGWDNQDWNKKQQLKATRNNYDWDNNYNYDWDNYNQYNNYNRNQQRKGYGQYNYGSNGTWQEKVPNVARNQDISAAQAAHKLAGTQGRQLATYNHQNRVRTDNYGSRNAYNQNFDQSYGTQSKRDISSNSLAYGSKGTNTNYQLDGQQDEYPYQDSYYGQRAQGYQTNLARRTYSGNQQRGTYA